jgi:hypothetical protein
MIWRSPLDFFEQPLRPNPMHDAALVGALISWKADSVDMYLHIRDEQEGAVVPPSGSGRRMREQACAILAALRTRVRPSPKQLYRGSHETPVGVCAWTTLRCVAECWARKSGGKIFVLPVDTCGLCVEDFDVPDGEEEWLVDVPVTRVRIEERAE